MVAVLTNNWWALVIRGVVAVAFGLAALFWPELTLVALVVMFGAFVLVDGAFAIVAAVWAARERLMWWPLLVEGALGVALGVIAIAWPTGVAQALIWLIAAWALLTGALTIMAAIRLRQVIEREWLFGTTGALAVLLGVILLLNPEAGALAMIWFIGAYAIIAGFALISVGLWLRNWRDADVGPLARRWRGAASRS